MVLRGTTARRQVLSLVSVIVLATVLNVNTGRRRLNMWELSIGDAPVIGQRHADAEREEATLLDKLGADKAVAGSLPVAWMIDGDAVPADMPRRGSDTGPVDRLPMQGDSLPWPADVPAYRPAAWPGDGILLLGLPDGAAAGSDSPAAADLERLLAIEEHERMVLAQDLHDDLGQDLTALSLGLRSLAALLDSPAAIEKSAALQKIIDHMSIAVHWTAAGLRPPQFSDRGFRSAIEDLLADWAERLGVPIADDLSAVPEAAEQGAALTLYRVLQEALNNVGKHAGASTVDVSFTRRDGLLHLVVADDGVGFERVMGCGSARGGLGLPGMKQRLALLGGDFAIDSAPGCGTVVYASIPLSRLNSREERLWT